MLTIDYLLFTGSVLILISIIIARFSDKLGIPALVLFLGIGMLAGSEGIGGIYFDDAEFAQAIGIVALVFILFSGGLSTNWDSVKPVLWQALSLATIGVFITAFTVGLFAYFVFGIPILHACLIGAIISSTDAAAVFSVLRSKNVALKGKLQPLLELESGSNDPMAVFLTIGLIELIVSPSTPAWSLIYLFFMQMGVGVILGFLSGKLMLLIINKIKMPYEGIYPVFSLAFVCFVYALTALLSGSGFLAVYIAGLVVGKYEFIHKKSLLRFFDGLAWLSQIVMFLALGLLVFPSRLFKVVGAGLILALFLMLLARPLSVFIALAFSRLDWHSKVFISWVGLRGAVPIILATFPLLEGIPDTGFLFSLIFFVVLTSALLQGWSLSPAAKLFRVNVPFTQKIVHPIELAPSENMNTDLIDIIVPYKSPLIGKSVGELMLPKNSLITLINRNGGYIVPGGETILEAGDILLILADKDNIPEVKNIFP